MSWDDAAASWDNDPMVRAYAEAAFTRLTTHPRCVDMTALRVLDFGCGTGLLTEQLAPLAGQVVAIDISATMVAVLDGKVRGGKLHNVETVIGSIDDPETAATPALRAPFDLVVCSSVCAFLDDYPATAAALTAKLARGGAFIQFDWELDPNASEPYGFDRQRIADVLSAVGLANVTVETAFDIEVAPGKHMRPLWGHGIKP